MNRFLSSFIIFFLFTTAASAQRKSVIGRLEDSVTHFAIMNGTVTNFNTKQETKSDEKGFFKIEVAPNDIITGTAQDYRRFSLPYTILYTDTITMYLPPAGNLLPEVTVRTKYNKYQLDSLRRKQEFDNTRQKTMGQMSSSQNGGFGVAFNLDKLLKKRPTSSKRSKQIYEETEESHYVDFRFSPQMVAYYTGLKGDSLRTFMNQNQPEYKWLRKNLTNEDVMFYINDKLKAARTLNNSK